MYKGYQTEKNYIYARPTASGANTSMNLLEAKHDLWICNNHNYSRDVCLFQESGSHLASDDDDNGIVRVCKIPLAWGQSPKSA
jgi:hypothetical protein